MATVLPRGATSDAVMDAFDPAMRGSRIRSIDIIRGAVMVLMALDHVRVYMSGAGIEPTDLSRTTVALFFTRWVTHFCAPAFVFLAGTSAYLHGERLRDPAALSRFLLTRGLWLVLIELTVVRLSWTFNFDYGHYVLAGVIWMIGWCMVLMAGVARLPVAAIGAIGVAIIAGHNAIDPWIPTVAPAIRESSIAWAWQVLYFGGAIPLGAEGVLIVLYSIVPWIGVMAAGYAFGRVMTLPPEARRRACLAIGMGAIAAFLVLRGFNLYGNARPWMAQRNVMFSVLSVLNTQKYPASLLFLLMTLGPTIALMPWLDRAKGRALDVLETFGRVPFFYYVLHIPLIHVIALLLSVASYGEVIPWMFGNHPIMPEPPPPEGYGYGLPVVYAVTAAVVAMLYLPCRWFAAVRARRRTGWVSYL